LTALYYQEIHMSTVFAILRRRVTSLFLAPWFIGRQLRAADQHEIKQE